jgi:hypothetical protein
LILTPYKNDTWNSMGRKMCWISTRKNV